MNRIEELLEKARAHPIERKWVICVECDGLGVCGRGTAVWNCDNCHGEGWIPMPLVIKPYRLVSNLKPEHPEFFINTPVEFITLEVDFRPDCTYPHCLCKITSNPECDNRCQGLWAEERVNTRHNPILKYAKPWNSRGCEYPKCSCVGIGFCKMDEKHNPLLNL